MKVRVSRSRLLEGLKKVQSAANGKNAMPILANVNFVAKGEKISLTATDLDITLYSEVDGQVDEPGEITIPVKKLVSIVNTLVEGEIVITTSGEMVTLVCGSYKGKIMCLPSSQFPKIPVDKVTRKIKVEASDLSDLIKKVSYAQSTDDTRKTLMSVLFSVEGGKLRCVATDGRRMAVAEHDVEGEDGDFILQSRSVSIVRGFADGGDEIEISVMPTQIVFSRDGGSSVMYSKIIDDVYPNYQTVIPKGEMKEAVVDREMVISAINRVASNDGTGLVSVKLTFANGELTIENRNDANDESKDFVPVKYTGDTVTTIFNPKYLTEPLGAATVDEIVFKITDGSHPAVIEAKDEAFFCVLMPMREH